MQELPHGFPLVQCGPFVSPAEPLRQELINCLRVSPVMPLACALQSFIRCCCTFDWALAGIVSATTIAIAIGYFLTGFCSHSPIKMGSTASPSAIRSCVESTDRNLVIADLTVRRVARTVNGLIPACLTAISGQSNPIAFGPCRPSMTPTIARQTGNEEYALVQRFNPL